MCDVMGDIRLIRNCIVHNNAVADNRVQKLTTFTWIKEGPLVFVNNDMTKIQEAVNTMSVYCREA